MVSFNLRRTKHAPSFMRPKQFVRSVVGEYEPDNIWAWWMNPHFCNSVNFKEFEENVLNSKGLLISNLGVNESIRVNINDKVSELNILYLTLETWIGRIVKDMNFFPQSVDIGRFGVEVIFSKEV
jgi:hypothetical protein